MLFSILLFVLFISGCSGPAGKSTAKLEITSSFLFAGQPGGVILYTIDKTRGLQQAFIMDSNQITLNLEDGSWDFAVVAWSGASTMSGTMTCALSSLNLKSSDSTIPLTLSQAACNQDFFAQANFRANGVIKGLEFVNCLSTTGIVDPATACDSANRGMGNSYRVKMAGHSSTGVGGLSGLNPSQLNYLSSSCQTANTLPSSVSSPSIKLPSGGPLFRPASVIEVFSDTSCSQGKRTFFYPNGLASSVVGTNSAITFAPPGAIKPRVYLEYGGLVITGSASLGTIAVGGSSTPQVLTLTNYSQSNATFSPPTLPTHFSYAGGTFPGSGGNCISPLSPASSCTISVVFSPTATGNFNSNVNFNYNDGNPQTSQFLLSGIAVTPGALTGAPSVVSFAGSFSDVNPVQSILLTNTGGYPITVTSALTGTNPAKFSVSGCSSQLLLNDYCYLSINYGTSGGFVTPAHTATLTLNYYNGVSSQNSSINLTGSIISVGDASTTGVVKPFYTNGTKWSDYVGDTDPYLNSSVATCSPNTHSSCVHGGEKFISTLPSEFNGFNCSVLSGSDQLGVFKWECVDNGGTKTFRMAGFLPGKGLRNLVSATSWNSNQLKVFYNGTTLAYQTPLSTWWTNSIYNINALGGSTFAQTSGFPSVTGVVNRPSNLSLTASLVDPLVSFGLSQQSAIYTVSSNISVPAIHFENSNISLVTLGAATLSTNNTASNLNYSCNTSSGSVGSPNTISLLCVGTNHNWLEVLAEGHSTNTNSRIVSWINPAMSRIHNSRFQNGGRGLYIKGATKPNIVSFTQIVYNTSYGVLLESANKTEILDSLISYNSSDGLLLSNSSDNGIRFSIVSSNGASSVGHGINVVSGANNKLEGLKVHFNAENGILLNNTSGNRVWKSLISFNNNAGVQVQYTPASSYNTVHDSTISSNCQGASTAAGLGLLSAQDTKVYNIISTANKCAGVKLTSSSTKNTFLNMTVTNNYSGVGIDSSNSNTFVNVVSAGNNRNTAMSLPATDGSGLFIIISISNKINNFLTAHNKNGFYFDYATPAAGTNLDALSGLFLVGNNSLNDCDSPGTNGGANFSLSSATCSISSGATLVSGKNIEGSFKGFITTDVKNTHAASLSANSGIISFASITDFSNFDNLFRYWGRKGTSGGPLTSTNADACRSGSNCAVWDWRLASTDTGILNRSGNGSSANSTFSPGSTCPTELSGASASNYITDSGTTASVFLTRAYEIAFDGTGDDDGLCESSEACIYSPNLGRYQGEEASGLTSTCTVSSGTVLPTSIQKWNTNGI